MAVLYRSLFAAVGLFALGLQYGLMLGGNPGVGAGELTVNFFSYFTILTNVVATLAFIAALLPATTWAGRLGCSPQLRAAVAMYIAVVGLTYHFLLAATWAPQGWSLLANNLLHYVMPLGFVADWLLFTPKGTLGWRDPARWLAFPLIYMVWTLIHGWASGWSEGWWPYWFVNVPALGLGKTAFWFSAMLVFFLTVGFGVVAIDRMLGQRDRTAASA
jgi:hypothetical protein